MKECGLHNLVTKTRTGLSATLVVVVVGVFRNALDVLRKGARGWVT